jgi:hypothetical protein
MKKLRCGRLSKSDKNKLYDKFVHLSKEFNPLIAQKKLEISDTIFANFLLRSQDLNIDLSNTDKRNFCFYNNLVDECLKIYPDIFKLDSII